jgi:structural maintenance of chromosomes protein 5
VTECKEVQRQIDLLDSQEGQRLSQLKQVNPDAARGWEWLQENRDSFEKEVFGPPMVTCSLRDDRYSDLIQVMLGYNDFVCFTAQTRKDHMKLSDQFYKEMGLSVTIRTCATDFRSFNPPVSPAAARQLGLDGFAIDYLEGPEPVLAMLCSEKYLHTAGVALNEITNDQYNELFNGQKISQWATGQTSFRVIRRREYGPEATTTSTRKISRGRFWTDQAVNTDEKAPLQEKLEELSQQRAELKKDYDVKLQAMNDLDDTERDTREKLVSCQRLILPVTYANPIQEWSQKCKE